MSDAWSWSMSTLQITGSSVSGPLNAVTMGGDGTVEGEEARGEDSFGAPGIVFRPRPPSDVEGSDGQTYRVGAEAMGARMGDRLTPFTWRDLRLNKVFPAPKEGTIALVGYGGAFLAFDDTTDGKQNTVATLYAPYAKVNGVATKCHTIVLDPAQEAIGIVHGEGNAIALAKDNSITFRADGSTSMVLTPGTFQVAATNISLNGNVACGGVAAFPVVNATAWGVILTALAGALNAATPVTPYEIALHAALLAIVASYPATCPTKHLAGI